MLLKLVWFLFIALYPPHRLLTMAPAALGTSAASAQLVDAIKRVVPIIREIMDTRKQKLAGHMQPAVDKIVEVCLQADAAYKKNV